MMEQPCIYPKGHDYKNIEVLIRSRKVLICPPSGTGHSTGVYAPAVNLVLESVLDTRHAAAAT